MDNKAYKSKGMKAPRPPAHAAKPGDQSMAPAVKPSMQHREPNHKVEAGDQSMSPSSKKSALPMQDAPPGVAGVNGGSSVAMPQGGGPGESKV